MKTTKQQRDVDGPTAHSENIIGAAGAEGKGMAAKKAAANHREDRAFGRQLSTNNGEAAGAATLYLSIAPNAKQCIKVSVIPGVISVDTISSSI